MDQSIGRVRSLDTLRGLAALSVCWFHFVGNTLIGHGWLAASGKHGFVGVYVFFVVSGFVIPLALQRESYRIKYYGTFLLKRFARIYPAYLASVAISFGFLVLYGIYRDQPRVEIDSESLLLHLVFLNEFFDKPWLNSIYWTLVIEVQFYLSLGLLFPLIVSSRRINRLIAFTTLALPVLLFSSPTMMFSNAFLLLMGIATFQLFVGIIKRLEYSVLLSIFTVCCCLSLSWLAALAGVVTVLAINLMKQGNALFDSVGKISYSLYLLHGSIGSFALYLLLEYVVGDSQFEKAFAVLCAVGFSIAVAAVSYSLIEKPAMQYGGSLRYQPPADDQVTDAQALMNLPLVEATLNAEDY